MHLEMTEAKAFRIFTYTRIHCQFKNERLSANIKVTLHKALIRPIMTYTCPACELTARHLRLKITVTAKQE
jgi:hypothetical protein